MGNGNSSWEMDHCQDGVGWGGGGFLFTRGCPQILRQDCKGKGGRNLVVWTSGSLKWQLTNDIGPHDWQLPYVICELFKDANHKQTRHCLQLDPLQTMYLENPELLEPVKAQTMRSDNHEHYPRHKNNRKHYFPFLFSVYEQTSDCVCQVWNRFPCSMGL